MSKKRKSASAAGGGRWEAALMASAFSEESWKTNVQFIVENDMLDEAHIKALEHVVKIPQRKLFSYLHKDDLMQMVSELGNPKNKKPPKVPQFYEVTEIIFGLRNAGQEVPLPLWAKLIKFGLLNIKDQDLKRREGESKPRDDKTAKGSAKKRPRSKSAKGKGKKTPEPQLPKKDWSQLKKRGDEDVGSKFIDDEPDDGPQHYIFISGFRKPQLIPILSEIGVNVNGVIRIESESYDLLAKLAKEKFDAEGLDDDAIAVKQSEREIQGKELAVFWKLLPMVLQRSATSKLQDLGCHEYTVKKSIYPGDWHQSENMIGFGTTLFEDIACKVYDCLDWERQYLHYLKNVNLLHVPKYGEQESLSSEINQAEPKPVSSATGKRDKAKVALEPAQPLEEMVPPISPVIQEVDTRYYRDLMDCVPMESVSVPLVVHCMLEQVVAVEKDLIPPSERDAPNRADGIHLALAECIAESLEGLCLSEEDEKILAKDFPQYKQKLENDIEKNRKPEGPILLHYGDDASVRNHHLAALDDFMPKDAEENLLYKYSTARLISPQTTATEIIHERSSRLHELYRYITSVTDSNSANAILTSEIDRALQLFAFERMDIAQTDENNVISMPSQEAGLVWDDPYTSAARLEIMSNKQRNDAVWKSGQEKGIEENSEKQILQSTEDFINSYVSPKRILDKYTYTETFKTPVLLQMIEEARQTYPCMETYQHKGSNSTLVMFHYPMSDNLQGTHEWSSSLHSDVGFRNYLEYVAGKIRRWMEVEEKKYQAERVALEMEKAHQEAVNALKAVAESKTPPSTAKRPRSKSPKKGSRRGSASRSSSKVGTTDDSQQFSTPFIRRESLKAEKEIQSKLKEEAERVKKEKESKQSTRTKTPDKKGSKSAGSRASMEGKRSSSIKRPKSGRRKSKSRSRSSSSSGDKDESKIYASETSEILLPFIGYDVGNNLINIHGKSSYLYPCDGGTIKSEKIQYVHGETSVKVTAYKDGHVFMLHIIDPKDLEVENELDDLLTSLHNRPSLSSQKEETEMHTKIPESDVQIANADSKDNLSEKKEKVKCYSLFGSWCASLCDGMMLSLSSNGPDGMSVAAVESKEKMQKILGDIPLASSPSPVPPGMETPKKGKKSPRGRSPRGKSPKGAKKGKDADKDAEALKLEEQRIQEELERKLLEAQEAEETERRKKRMPSFQQLYTSCPDGLTVQFQLDPTSAVTNPSTEEDEYKLMVRQSYPYKTSGRQETERSRSKPAMEEVSRSILADGRVIKLMKDGSTKVLFSDGTVCFNVGSGPIIQEQKMPITPHSLPSGLSQPQHNILDDQRNATSPGSKKGSRGRKSSGKTNPEATATDPSIAGTVGGQGAAAGLEAEAGAKFEADQEKAASWFTTYMSGEVTLTKPDGMVLEQDSLLCYTATDPITGEVMLSRQDNVIRVDRPDGSSVCDHTDGTRITRFCREEEKLVEEEEQGDIGPSCLMWFVRVECPGYATVTFNVNDFSCTTTFGSGSSLLTNTDGTYQLSHWNGGRLDVATDGSVVYTPRPDNDLLLAALSAAEDGKIEEGDMKVANPPLPESIGSYFMKHNADICCEAIDQEGNVFQVTKSGEISVMNPSNAHNQPESEVQPDSRPITANPMEHHPPRLFVVYQDGTGMELLRYKDVQDYIGDAHLDPTTAIIREPLPNDEKAVGITVMRPHYGNSGDAWILHKEEQDIIPQHLKTRDLTLFPPTEFKKPGPPFATTLGRGLAVGSAPTPLVQPLGPLSPTVLELRQLIQYQPITQELRDRLTAKLLEYGRAVCAQEAQREAMKVHEPRTAEEQMRARDLLSLVLEFDEEGTPRTPDAAPRPIELIPAASKGPQHPTVIPDEQFSSLVKIKYEAGVAPLPLPVVPPPRKKLTQGDWERISRGIAEEKRGREVLRNKDVPPYFESEEGKAWLLTQATNMTSAAIQLVQDPRQDGTEVRLYETAGSQHAERNRLTSFTSPPSQVGVIPQRGSGAGIVSDTPSKIRPTNPTPAHATGDGTPTKVRPENPTPFAAAQPRNTRPSNPTPSHAKTSTNRQDGGITQQYQPSPIPENPTSAQQREGQMSPARDQDAVSKLCSPNKVLPLETDTSDLLLTRSLLYGVTGEPRKERIKLPSSILSDKPGATPNDTFINVEDPVRRKVRTSSVAGGLDQGHVKVAERGFHLFPPEVIFGVLREGSTYAATVHLKNTGIDLCRFKIKQPPPGTGMRVLYAIGPVAAGMEAKLDIQIYAIAVGVEGDSGVGIINHQLEIITETEILHLPISAIVLTTYDYDNRTESMPVGGRAPGVKLCSDKPPSRDGIVRPLKLVNTEGNV